MIVNGQLATSVRLSYAFFGVCFFFAALIDLLVYLSIEYPISLLLAKSSRREVPSVLFTPVCPQSRKLFGPLENVINILLI